MSPPKKGGGSNFKIASTGACLDNNYGPLVQLHSVNNFTSFWAIFLDLAKNWFEDSLQWGIYFDEIFWGQVAFWSRGRSYYNFSTLPGCLTTLKYGRNSYLWKNSHSADNWGGYSMLKTKCAMKAHNNPCTGLSASWYRPTLSTNTYPTGRFKSGSSPVGTIHRHYVHRFNVQRQNVQANWSNSVWTT